MKSSLLVSALCLVALLGVDGAPSERSSGRRYPQKGNRGRSPSARIPGHSKNIPLPLLELQEFCDSVPFVKPDKCRTPVDPLENYGCTKSFDHLACGEETVTVKDLCLVHTDQHRDYPCWKTEIIERCFERIVAKDSVCELPPLGDALFPCPQTIIGQDICKVEDVPFPDTCFRQRNRERSFECTELKDQEVCVDVPYTERKMCQRTVNRPESYSCPQERFREECKNVPHQVDGICERTVMQDQPYRCTVPQEEERCSVVDEAVRSCARTVENEEAYECTKERMEERCGHSEGAKQCYKDVVVEKPYDCSTQETRQNCLPLQCRGIHCSKNNIRPKCQYVSVDKPKTCYRSVTTKQAYPCAEQRESKRCRSVPVSYSGTCYRKVQRQESYPCTNSVPRRKCESFTVNVPSTCSRKVPVQEEYSCKKTEYRTECGNVPSTVMETCTREVPVTVDFPCPERRTRPRCSLMQVAVASTCHLTLPFVETYACDGSVNLTTCVRAPPKTVDPQCYRPDHEPKRYPCVELETVRHCEDLPSAVEGVCTLDYTETTATVCDKEIVRRRCGIKTSTYQSHCVRPVPKDKVYDCFEEDSKTQCRDLPVAPKRGGPGKPVGPGGGRGKNGPPTGPPGKRGGRRRPPPGKNGGSRRPSARRPGHRSEVSRPVESRSRPGSYRSGRVDEHLRRVGSYQTGSVSEYDGVGRGVEAERRSEGVRVESRGHPDRSGRVSGHDDERFQSNGVHERADEYVGAGDYFGSYDVDQAPKRHVVAQSN